MDKLQSMRAFAKVVQHGSFAAAARELRLSRSVVSKYVELDRPQACARAPRHLRGAFLPRAPRHESRRAARLSERRRCLAARLKFPPGDGIGRTHAAARHLRRRSCRSRYRIKCGSHGTGCRISLVAQPMPFREPTRIVVRKPCVARCVLPNQCLQRQIDSNRLS
jgi:hypothetical protein